MNNAVKRIEKLRKSYDRKLERESGRATEMEAKKSRLTFHRNWSLGYFSGRSDLLADICDDLDELLESMKDESEDMISKKDVLAIIQPRYNSAKPGTMDQQHLYSIMDCIRKLPAKAVAKTEKKG